MARDHTRVNLDIWGDDEFRDLPVDAQNLYWTLWTSPDRTYCGGHWWHAGKLAQFAEDWTISRVEWAGSVLSQRLFLVIDEPVEECLLRSWIKHDGLWKTPNLAVSMANARAAMASRICRGVVVHEVKKLVAANPDLGGWSRKEVVNLLSQRSIDAATIPPFTPGSTPPSTPPPTPGSTPAVTLSDGVGVNPSNNPPPTTATATPTATEGGYVSRGRHLAAVPDSEIPPSPTCSEFGKPNHPVRCGACADARRNRNQWDIDQAASRAQAITDCALCDDEGWRKGPDGLPLDDAARCDHTPEAAAHG